jgi:hypothetical protein
MGDPRRHAERRDAQVMSDRPKVTAGVGEFLDLVQTRNRVSSHGLPLPVQCAPASRNAPRQARSVEASSLPYAGFFA